MNGIYNALNGIYNPLNGIYNALNGIYNPLNGIYNPLNGIYNALNGIYNPLNGIHVYTPLLLLCLSRICVFSLCCLVLQKTPTTGRWGLIPMVLWRKAGFISQAASGLPSDVCLVRCLFGALWLLDTLIHTQFPALLCQIEKNTSSFILSTFD